MFTVGCNIIIDFPIYCIPSYLYKCVVHVSACRLLADTLVDISHCYNNCGNLFAHSQAKE